MISQQQNKQLIETESDQIKITALDDDARILAISEQVLNEHIAAFKELADEGDSDAKV